MMPTTGATAASRRTLRRGLTVLSCVLIMASCGGRGGGGGGETAGDDTTFERIRREGVVRVGYANEAPYAYFDSNSSRLTGEAPEVARLVLAELGVSKVEGVLTEFGSLIPGLKAKRFDIIAAGMYITPERCREVAFTNPTYSIGESFLIRSGNPLDLHGYEDVVAHSEARLGVVAGTVEHGYARSVGVPEDRIVVFPDNPSAVAGVQTDRIDAFAGTSLTIHDLLEKADDPSIERAEPFRDPVIDGKPIRGYGAFAVRKEDASLLAELNARLAALIGSDAHRSAVEPFGFTATETPGDMTAAQLCTP